MPVGIVAFDQLDLPIPPPAFEALLANNCGGGIVEDFVIDELIDAMVMGEAGNKFFLVLVYTPDEVVRYADVDCPVFTTRQDVDVEMSDHGECRGYGSRRSFRSAGMTTTLGALQIRLECVDRHLQRGIGVGAPELARIE